MKKLLFIVSFASLLGFSPAQAEELEQGVVVVQHAGSKYVSSMRFEVTGAMTEIKNCRTNLTGASAFLNECQSLGTYSTDEVGLILQAGWIESILADAEEVGAFVGGAALTGAAVYVALNKVSKGLLSTPGAQMTIRQMLIYAGLIGGNSVAAVAGGGLTQYGYEMTARGANANAIDHRNEVARKLQNGETVIEALDEAAVSDLFSYVVGQINTLSSN